SLLVDDMGCSGTMPRRLLHLSSDGCRVHLVELDDNPLSIPYVALSYCWGDSQFKTVKSTITTFMRDGLEAAQLPVTFQDAITVVLGLGYEHLWIDALCIVQDDRDDWINESRRMGATYGHAVCTLHAVDSASADGGLIPRDSTLALPGVLNTRGWATQETALSPRSLMFGLDGVKWECRESAGCTEGQETPPAVPGLKSLFAFFRDWDSLDSAGNSPEFQATLDKLEFLGLTRDKLKSTGMTHKDVDQLSRAIDTFQELGMNMDRMKKFGFSLQTLEADPGQFAELIGDMESFRTSTDSVPIDAYDSSESDEAESSNGGDSDDDDKGDDGDKQEDGDEGGDHHDTSSGSQSEGTNNPALDDIIPQSHGSTPATQGHASAISQPLIPGPNKERQQWSPLDLILDANVIHQHDPDRYLPFLSKWWDFLYHYTPRHLTREPDRFLALNGISSVAERSVKKIRNTWGLWKIAIETELMWYVDPVHHEAGARASEWLGPSWSWVAVKSGARIRNAAYEHRRAGHAYSSFTFTSRSQIHLAHGTSFDHPLPIRLQFDWDFRTVMVEMRADLRAGEIVAFQDENDRRKRYRMTLARTNHQEYEFWPDVDIEFPLGEAVPVWAALLGRYDTLDGKYVTANLMLKRRGNHPHGQITPFTADVKKDPDLLREHRGFTRLGYME
ncbi:heterokaryon incompatibility protein-domain-containing protein, partial [Apodospora peruviana]